MDFFDTIAAISTPVGNGGIGIIRISGKDSFEILGKIFSTPKNKSLKSHTINYGFIKDGDTVIDEVMVSVMKAPNTYTKEDIAEINCHGGMVTLTRVLEVVLKNGARLAETGEFTKRAFLNGRIDLSQAEAVIDIINAKTPLSQENAVKQLEGKLSKKIKETRDKILTMMAHIEASIDYPEHELEESNISNTRLETEEIIKEIDKLFKSSEVGKIIKDGVETVILGKPNVGKSSLLNVILNEERAIVTDIPGTTRDVLTEYVNISGIPLKLVDTAGLRESEDTVEKIGVNRSREYAKKADLILYIIDASIGVTKEDEEVLRELSDKKIILIINKTDLSNDADINKIYKYIQDTIKVSVIENKGISDIFEKIKEMFIEGKINTYDDVLVTNIRHRSSLERAKTSLLNVLETIDNGFTEDFLTIDLNDAYRILGEIIGETVEDDLIDKIFSEFCLGK